MHPLLRDAASLAASSVDKRSAAGFAASLAERVAGTDSRRGVRVVAGLLAQGLNTSLQQSARPVPVASATPRAPADRPAATGSWLAALQLLQDGGQPPASADAAPPRRTHAGRPAGRPATAGAPTSFRGSLTGHFDTANIGAFAFSLYNGSQLQVNQLRAPGNVGGSFWLGELQRASWYRLQDRGDRLLPVWVQVDGVDVNVQVGDGPGDAPRLHPTDMLPNRG